MGRRQKRARKGQLKVKVHYEKMDEKDLEETLEILASMLVNYLEKTNHTNKEKKL